MTFTAGNIVWFITSQSRKVLWGKIRSTAPNGCHTIESGTYEHLRFDDELYSSKEEATKSLERN